MSVEIHYGGRVYPLAYPEVTAANITVAVQTALAEGDGRVFFTADTDEGAMSFLIGTGVPFAVREVVATASVYETRGLEIV